MNQQKTIKCACYARVSTDEQGSSIINQHDYFKNYVEKNGWELYDIYTDEAISGTKITKRVAFQKMLEEGKQRKYDILLAKSFTRFGRNQRETLTAISQLRAVGVRIIFTENNLDSETDATKFGLFAWLAEQEAQTTSERLKLIWQHYDEKGRIHACTPPYGYDYSEKIKNFVINEEEAKIVRRIYELYIQGYGLDKIARTLTSENIPTKKGGVWAGITIRKIITNPVYTGTLIQGKSRSIDVTMKEREKIDPEEWQIHPNHHDAIISDEVFQKVQILYNERAAYSSNFTRKTKHSNASLFSNLIKCKECGATFTIKRQKHFKNYSPYYTCINYELKGATLAGHKRIAIYEDTLITVVKNELLDWRKNDYEKIRKLFESLSESTQPQNIQFALQTIEKKIKEHIDLGMALLVAKNQGEIGVLQFKMQNEIIEKNLQELEKKKEEYLKLSQEIQSQNYKNAEEKRLIKNIDLLLSLDPSEWTNAMLKTVFGGFVVDVNGTIKADIIYQNPERSNLGINIFGTKELLQWLDSLLPMSLTSLLGYTA